MKNFTALLLFSFLFFSAFQTESPIAASQKNQLQKDTTQIALLKKQAKMHYDSSRYDSALVYYEQVTNLQKRNLIQSADQSSWEAYVQNKNITVECYARLGRFQEGLDLVLEDIEKTKARLGETHRDIAKSYFFIGCFHDDLAQYKSAEIYYNKAIEGQMLLEDTTDQIDLAGTYNNLGVVYDRTGSYQKAMDSYQKSLALRLKMLGENDSRTADSYANIGICYDNLEDLEKALYFNEKARNIYKQTQGENFIRVGFSYSNGGFLYREIGQYEKALEQHEKALQIYMNLPNQEYHIGHEYSNFGVVYRILGQYEKALEYTQKALVAIVTLHGENHPEVAIVYINLARTYKDIEKFEEALEFTLKALDIYNATFEKENRKTADAYENLGYITSQSGDYEKALEYFQKSLLIKKKLLGDKNLALASSYNQIGNIFFLKKDYEKALYNLKIASTIFEDNFGSKHPDLASNYNEIGTTLTKINQREDALLYFQKALIANTRNFYTTDLNLNPTANDTILSGQLLFESLSLKASTLIDVFHQGKNIKNLELANTTYQTAVEWIDNVRSSYTRSEDKQGFLTKSFAAYEGYIQTAHTLFKQTNSKIYLEQAFQAMEKSRALVLLENFQSDYAKSYVGIPKALLDKEYDIRTLITYYEKSIFEEQLKRESAENGKIASWQNRLFDLRQSEDSIRTLLENRYPEYYRLKYEANVIAIEEVQNSLPNEETVLLEYFVGDSTIYAFLISRNDYQTHEIKKDFPLAKLVKQLQTGAYAYHLSGTRSDKLLQTYADSLLSASHELYNKVFAPIAESVNLPTQLIIVPDGVLGYVPFELLISELPEDNSLFGTHRYLLHNHQISYTYSANLLQEMQQKEHTPTKGDFLAFAPIFEAETVYADASRSIDAVRGALSSLTYNIPEVEALEKTMGGKIFTGTAATEDNFNTYAPDYKILHLATHGKANDEIGDYAYLAFTEIKDSLENELLYNRDLYNMQLNADMVVLSACETGIGELQRGEGIISLARGFSYAGAKSIITTLWSVNDQKTKELMESFYYYIKKGDTKDKALRQAKLDFLQKYSHEAHPFFWASFVPVGDMSAIDLKEGINWWIWGTAAALTFILFSFFIRKKRKFIS